MRRFGYFIFCAILVVATPGLLLASNKTIKVGIYQNKPKVFIDSASNPQGFFIDILNHIAQSRGLATGLCRVYLGRKPRETGESRNRSPFGYR